MAQRKLPQGIQAHPSVPVRQHFDASRAKESEELSQLVQSQETQRQLDSQWKWREDVPGNDVPPAAARQCDDKHRDGYEQLRCESQGCQ